MTNVKGKYKCILAETQYTECFGLGGFVRPNQTKTRDEFYSEHKMYRLLSPTKCRYDFCTLPNVYSTTFCPPEENRNDILTAKTRRCDFLSASEMVCEGQKVVRILCLLLVFHPLPGLTP